MPEVPPPQPTIDGLPFVIPTPMAAPPRRPSILTSAGVALIVLGLLHGAGGALALSLGNPSTSSQLLPVGTTGLTTTLGIALLALATLELFAGVLVFRLNRAGRVLGLLLAGGELLQGLRMLVQGQGSAVLGLLVAAFLLFALATTGDVFARSRRG